ncbi:hypothetical protein ACFOEW_01725 [Alteromonas oceani]|uniref:Uncharacterized protein n=1 Tax=Alteromonas oceani TaxID=2071609 RepID=A0ABV7JUQ5_9ALTE|nr:hypothetical protein [Alteromonas oceani]
MSKTTLTSLQPHQLLNVNGAGIVSLPGLNPIPMPAPMPGPVIIPDDKEDDSIFVGLKVTPME